MAAGAGAFHAEQRPSLYNWIEIAQDFSYFRIYVREQKKAAGSFADYFEVVKPADAIRDH